MLAESSAKRKKKDYLQRKQSTIILQLDLNQHSLNVSISADAQLTLSLLYLSWRW